MGFKINTNVAALNAHRSSVQNNVNLDNSLAKLSSGLRINKAADDASGMAIANSLRAQANGLGQAINNANDGIAVVQTADGALEEYTNIINIIRTKSIQAASDGQNSDSRAAIQADINRLIEVADSIANTTQFNGQKLLDGTFTNKAFHIGAYANETVDLSVDSVRVGDVGAVNTAKSNGSIASSLLGTANGVQVDSQTGAYKLNSTLSINGQDVTATLNKSNANSLLDASSIAAAISDSTDVHAVATNTVKGSTAVGAGTIAGDTTDYLKINGIDIGTVTVTARDGTKALSVAINSISDLTGVTATVDDTGVLSLTSKDGSNISIDASGTGLGLTGLADSKTEVTSAVNGAINSAQTAALTLSAGELIINGVDMAGTYGLTGSAGSAREALEAAIKAIDGLADSTIANDGTITLRNNTGIDINVAANGAQVDFGAGNEGIFNSANKGTITMYSNETIKVDTTDPQGNVNDDILGFDKSVLRVSAGSDRLDTIDVTSRRSAELAILISDSALRQLDATRSDLGSVQNQLASTVRNISVTQVNVKSAESGIRDVDFAAESAAFSKFNILAQSGSYAMSQANAVQQNVLRLLQ